MDEKAKLRKKFLSTWNFINFPIEYKNTTCALTVKLDVWTRTYKPLPVRGNAVIPHCFLTKIPIVKCINRSEPGKVSNNNPARNSDVVIVCVTVLITVVVISITVITAVIVLVKRRKEIVIVEKEENNLYGTYHTQGIEYNLAIDENPRYNEDRENADGNRNHYIENNPSNYEIEDNNQSGKNNETENNNGPNSPNGNVYYQL